MPKIYVPNLEEFSCLIAEARRRSDCTVSDLGPYYKVIEGKSPLTFTRREMGARPAIWYSAFSGGIEGRFTEFGRDEVTLVDA